MYNECETRNFFLVAKTLSQLTTYTNMLTKNKERKKNNNAIKANKNLKNSQTIFS
jgi:hypothetical protein